MLLVADDGSDAEGAVDIARMGKASPQYSLSLTRAVPGTEKSEKYKSYNVGSPRYYNAICCIRRPEDLEKNY